MIRYDYCTFRISLLSSLSYCRDSNFEDSSTMSNYGPAHLVFLDVKDICLALWMFDLTSSKFLYYLPGFDVYWIANEESLQTKKILAKKILCKEKDAKKAKKILAISLLFWRKIANIMKIFSNLIFFFKLSHKTTIEIGKIITGIFVLLWFQSTSGNWNIW